MSTRKERAKAAKHTRGERAGKTATPTDSAAQPMVGIGEVRKQRSDAGTVRVLTGIADRLKALAARVSARDRVFELQRYNRTSEGEVLVDSQIVLEIKDIEHDIRAFDP